MHGITLTSGPMDWEVLQQENGFARAVLTGTFLVHPAALEVGVASAVPMVRVMLEEDNTAVIPWTPVADVTRGENFTGSFKAELMVPVGGPYRIETSLETRSTRPNLTWLYRGDCILHLCVGNLFIIAGQSNSAGYGRDYCADPPHLCVHVFRNRSRWDLATHPLNESTAAGSLPNEEMGIPGVSPYLSFGKKYYELTGIPVGLVQTALGGSSIRRWNPRDGSLYRNMINKIHETRGRFSGVLWYQGCEDAQIERAATYPECFKELVEALRVELGYEIPFFTMQLNRFVGVPNDEAWGMIREAQRQAALSIPGVSVLSTTNLSISDSVHISAQSNVVLGIRLARQCAHILNGGEEFEAPALAETVMASAAKKEELGLEGDWLELIFDHVKNCFLLYSSLGKDSGFTLEDSRGNVDIISVRANREDKNRMYLELGRQPEGEAFLSFAWQTDPVRLPMVDEVTFLPPLSFYRRKLYS